MELLEGYDVFEGDDSSEPKNEALNKSYDYTDMLLETAQFVHTHLKEKKAKVTNQQVMICVEEIFFYSLQKDSSHVDPDFAGWFIDLMVE